MAVGRPSIYSDALAAEICRRVERGETIAAIARDDVMPDHATLWRWIGDNDDFASAVDRARAKGCDALIDQTLEIADSTTAVDSPAARLRMQARQWIASKWRPDRYGDRVAVEHSGTVALDPGQLAARLEALTGAIRGRDGDD